MRSEKEIRKELNFWIKQGFLEYNEDREKTAFTNGFTSALKWVLEVTECQK